MGTLCRKGTASGKETSGAVSQGISPNGSGALEKLRQYRGAGARTGFTSAASVQVARATGAAGAWGTGAQHTGNDKRRRPERTEANVKVSTCLHVRNIALGEISLGNALSHCSVEELMHQRPNPISFFFQREMARVEKMQLCAGKISFQEFSTLHRKDSVVFAPSDQRGGLLFTEIRLPTGIGIQIPFCVVEDCKLNILVPRSVLISLVDHPIVRADLRRVADTMQIMPLGSFNRQKPVE